jgi:hypothetical protein
MGDDKNAIQFVQCPGGHFYNPQLHSVCPFCGAEPVAAPPSYTLECQLAESSIHEPRAIPAWPPLEEPVAPPHLPPNPVAPPTATPNTTTIPTPPAQQPVPGPVRCSAGHWFEPRLTGGTCPYCSKNQGKKKGRFGLLIVFLLLAIAFVAAAVLLWPQYQPAVTKLIAAYQTNSSGAAVNPTVESFDAVPDQVESGEAATLRWSASNTSQIEIDHGVGAVTGQEILVHPSATTLYTLTALGKGNSVTRAVLVTVKPKPELQLSIESFSADPIKIEKGQSTTLHWLVNNAISTSINNEIGVVDGNQKSVQPDATTTYTLTAANAIASVTQSVTVVVDVPPPPPPPFIEGFTASPDKIDHGQSSVLHWSVRNATGLTLDDGIGRVNGNEYTVHPDTTTTYTLTATGAGNDTRTIKVVVNEPPQRTITAPPPPQTGILRCPGVAVPFNGQVVFEHLPGGRLRFQVDPLGAWALMIKRQGDGSQTLTLVSKLPTIQTYCTVKWEVMP